MNPESRNRLVAAGRKVRYWHEERDRLILRAVEAGGTYREIGGLVGLSHTAVAFITRGRVSERTNEARAWINDHADESA